MTKKKAGSDLGADEVQKTVNKETEQGFSGVEVDPTPNEDYTVAGVIEGAPTPETDSDTAMAARVAAGLDPLAKPKESVADMVTVKNADGKSIQMSRKAYELNSDKYTLGGKD
jgi:hypothetical protein